MDPFLVAANSEIKNISERIDVKDSTSIKDRTTDGRTDGRRVTEIPEGGVRPPRPPTTPFKKICPPGKFFEMIKKKKTSASTVVDATFGRRKVLWQKSIGKRH